MARKLPNDDPLFAATWVHVFEEDTDQGAVYRPESEAIPLSRRPRERLQFDRDGTARVFRGAPDDRLGETPATWSEQGRAIVVRAGTGVPEMQIVDRTPSRLLIRTGSRGG